MEGLELTCFKIISSVGEARSCFIEAIGYAKDGKFEDADKMMKAGEEAFLSGHQAHADLIQQEAAGNKANVSLLLVHAEDQMMSAEAFKILAAEFMEVYKRLNK